MLRITPSQNGEAAIQYFNAALSKQDYYSDEKNVVGTWHGITAKKLGLGEEVTKEQFASLVKNRIPKQAGDQNDEAEAKLTPRDGKNRRAGYDFTFNAPKSFSVALAIGKDPRLLAAHNTAVEEAMKMVEQDMQTQQRGKKNITTGNIAYAKYNHELSRPVAFKNDQGKQIYIPDPHTHTHAYVFNCTWLEENNRYQSIEVGNVKADAPLYEAIYHSVLKSEVQKAGYEIEKTKNGWELKLIDRNTIKAFSNRTKQINQAAEDRKITNAKQADKIGAWTRENKNKSVGEDQVREHWENRLTETQKFNIRAAAGNHHNPVEQQIIKTSTGENYTPAMAIQNALDHHLQNKSSIPEKHILAEAINQSDFSYNQIKAAYDERKDVFGYHDNTRRIITTRYVLEEEKRMIRYANSEKGRHAALNPSYEPSSNNPDFDLNEDQKAAVKDVLNSNDGVMILKGGAGTGKTTISNEIKNGLEQHDKKLFAFAITSSATEVLQKEGFEANTVKALLDKKVIQDQLKDQVAFVDESGLIGVQQTNQLFEIAKAQNCRIIFSGDTAQHHSIARGDAQKILQQHAQLKAIEVNKVVRQKNQSYKEAVELLAKGETRKGFEKLKDNGGITEIEDPQERYEALANDFIDKTVKSYKDKDGKVKYEYAKRKGLVVSPTHQEGQMVNDIIRNKLKEKGLIDAQERKAEILRPLHLSDVYKQDPQNYDAGMVVRVHYNTGSFKAGSECEVIGHDEKGQVLVQQPGADSPTPIPLDKHEKFSVYQKEQTAFAAGDTVQMTANVKSMNNMALNNGNRYRITEYTQDGNMVLDNGAIVSSDSRTIKHGIYTTSIGSQGKTATDVFIAQGSGQSPASNQKQMYVSSSRGVQSCQIYTDNADDLIDVVERNEGSRESATMLSQKSVQEDFEHSWNLAVQEVQSYNEKYSSYEGLTEYQPSIHQSGFHNWSTDTATPSSPDA